jgi:hypothetical protein
MKKGITALFPLFPLLTTFIFILTTLSFSINAITTIDHLSLLHHHHLV